MFNTAICLCVFQILLCIKPRVLVNEPRDYHRILPTFLPSLTEDLCLLVARHYSISQVTVFCGVQMTLFCGV